MLMKYCNEKSSTVNIVDDLVITRRTRRTTTIPIVEMINIIVLMIMLMMRAVHYGNDNVHFMITMIMIS